MKQTVTLFCFLFLFSLPLAAEEPVTLHQAFDWALKQSESVAMQAENIRVAEAKFSQSIGAILPQIHAKGSEFLQDDSAAGSGGSAVGSTFTRFSRPELKINATQPIFSGLKEFYALRAVKAQKQGELFQWEVAKQLLFLDVARAFYATLDLQQEYQAAQAIRAALEKRMLVMKHRVGLGQSRLSEQISTETDLALAKASEGDVLGRLSNAREMLIFLTGHETGTLLDDTSLPLTANENDFLNDLSQRADLRAARAKKEAARARLSAEKGSRFPTVNAEANYYPYRVGFQKDIKWDALFFVDVPLFRGGVAHGKIAQAKAESRREELAYEEAERKAKLDAKQSYNNFLASHTRMMALENAQQNGEKNYHLVEREYAQGITNNLEVLSTLRQWQDLKGQYWQAYAQAKVDWWGLQIAAGERVP